MTRWKSAARLASSKCICSRDQHSYILVCIQLNSFTVLILSITFRWNYNACVSANPEDDDETGTNKWYMNWTAGQKCVQDCKSGGDCGGLAHTWDELYDTKADCCKTKTWVPLKDCLSDK